MRIKFLMVVFLYLLSAASWPVIAEPITQNAPQNTENEFKGSEKKYSITDTKKIIKEIKANPPFVNIEQEEVWSLKDDHAESENKIDIPDFDLSFMGQVITIIVKLIEALLWLFPLLIIYFFYRYRAYWLSLINVNIKTTNDSPLPDTLFGLDINKKTLPDDMETAIKSLWLNKHYREAISLLYRGALVVLFSHHKFDLPAGATENDCLLQLVRVLKPTGDAQEEQGITADADVKIKQFKRLTDTWVKAAYAHQFPSDMDFNQLVNYWNAFFLEMKKV